MEFKVTPRPGVPMPQHKITADMNGGHFKSPGDDVEFLDVHFRDVDFRGERFNEFRTSGCLFERCTFKSPLVTWHSWSAEFVDCVFARVENCKFSGTPFSDKDHVAVVPPRQRNEFRGNDFRRAGLKDVAFMRGIDIDAQLWPTGDPSIWALLETADATG